MSVFIKSEIELKKMGSNIQVARKRRGMSLADLSAQSGVSKTVLRRIESGEASVGIGKVFNVLDALGMLVGVAKICSPEMDYEQSLREIKKIREGKSSSHKPPKSNFVRFT